MNVRWRPWRGRTELAPRRLNSQPVVAHVKLVTRPGQVAHQWVAVAHNESTDTFTLWTVAHRRSTYEAHNPVRGMDYAEAISKMVGRLATFGGLST